ncbi:DUF3618 domain-containing protein [Micromonospora sp. GCM10011542]|uniref:DUF3618 domain-containing protein n=1 Tax=Micromonospora sp. GCM10011542 TaxID=3317337 RepID=UPI00360E0A8A
MTNWSSDPDRVRTDIERTRADLSDTVQALANKADMGAERVTELPNRVGQDVTQRAQTMQERAAGALSDVRTRTSAGLGGVARSVQQRGRALGRGGTRRPKAAIGEISGNARHQDGSALGSRSGAVGAVRSAIRRRPAIVAGAAAAAAVAVAALVGRQFRLGPGFAIRRRC